MSSLSPGITAKGMHMMSLLNAPYALAPLILIVTHFTEKKTEAWRGEAMSPRPQS